jgi:hypothetical protein
LHASGSARGFCWVQAGRGMALPAACAPQQ